MQTEPLPLPQPLLDQLVITIYGHIKPRFYSPRCSEAVVPLHSNSSHAECDAHPRLGEHRMGIPRLMPRGIRLRYVLDTCGGNDLGNTTNVIMINCRIWTYTIMINRRIGTYMMNGIAPPHPMPPLSLSLPLGFVRYRSLWSELRHHHLGSNGGVAAFLELAFASCLRIESGDLYN